MKSLSLTHLGDQELLCCLRTVLADERAATVVVLAHIAEVDARRLYAPAGYDSMFAYCVRELHLSEDEAFKRIRAARAARDFPAIFDAVADGRLHLTAIVLLSPHLTAENAAELLEEAAHQSKAEIQLLLACRFPQPDLPTRLEALSGARARSCQTQLVPEPVDSSSNRPAPGGVAPPGPRARVAPLSAQRFALQVTIAADTHHKLEYARALLGHAEPSGDLAQVLDRALDALITQLEKQKFGRTSRPGPQRASMDPRHIPVPVRHAVWERDGGQCTFTSENGHRCGTRTRLEFHHVDPAACGGEAKVEGIRLRCRTHNLYEAELVFGVGFMASKREEAERKREEARARAAVENDPERSVIPWLRGLGCGLQQAREAALYCERMPDAPMEERIKAALRHVPLRAVSGGA